MGCRVWDWIIFSEDMKTENIVKLLKLFGIQSGICKQKQQQQNKNPPRQMNEQKHRHKFFNLSISPLETSPIGMKALASKDTYAITSAITLYFENVHLFQCNWYIREHFEHNMNLALAYAQFPLQEILRDGRKLHPAEPSCLGKHRTQASHTSPATSDHCVVLGATPIHIWCYITSRLISDNPPFTTSQ